MEAFESRVLNSIDDVNENQWNEVVSQSGSGTIFQRVGWLRAIERGLDLQPKHIVVRKKGNPIAVCPNFTSDLQLPFTLPLDLSKIGFARLSSLDPGFGGPLVAANRDRALDGIFDLIDDVCDGTHLFHQMRILDPDHVQYAQALRKRGYQPSLLYCRFSLCLDDYDRILEEMDAERRKEIRDAKEENDPVVETEDVDRQSMREFYTEYLKTMDRVDGSPFPFAFFDALQEHLADRIEIFTAYVDGRPVGKHLYLCDRDQDSIHYFFAGVDERHFAYSSPTLLHDYALRWGIENGFSTFDFGSTNANYANGTYQYKKKFGADVQPVYEWEKGSSLVKWGLYRGARAVYRRYSDQLES